MTKKVSSMIMALMLIISAFAIPASAVGSTDTVAPQGDLVRCLYCKNETFYFLDVWSGDWVTMGTSPCTHGIPNAAHLSQRDTGFRVQLCAKCSRENGRSSVTRGRVFCSGRGEPCAIDCEIF